MEKPRIDLYPKYLNVGELIELLKQHDPDLMVVVTRNAKGHQYGVRKEEIEKLDWAYLGNDPEFLSQHPQVDPETDEELDCEYLQIGSI